MSFPSLHFVFAGVFVADFYSCLAEDGGRMRCANNSLPYFINRDRSLGWFSLSIRLEGPSAAKVEIRYCYKSVT
jgi:hypothetical protein